MGPGDANFGEELEGSSVSRSETERSGGASPKFAASSVGGLASGGAAPDPEVTDKPKRRRFTVEYKLSLLLRERRDQLRHPNYEKPVLLATGPNQVWSWDITKLLGPMKWVYFHLYVILDIFSRYVVGWMLAERESAELAKRLIKETCSKQGIVAEQLTLHADRGTSMKSKPLAMLLSDLGVTKTHSRPQVSNDNPYSESQFKTLKYRPEFPKRFGSIQHARNVCRDLFGWYNTEHYHSGIGLLTPESVHYGRAAMIVEGRRQVLLDFFGAHPERFVNGAPKPPEIPSAAWINPPTTKTTHQIGAQAVSEASDDLQVPLICNIYGEPVVSNSAASVTRTQHNHAQTQETRRDGSSAVRHPWVSSRTATHKRLLTKYTISVSQNH